MLSIMLMLSINPTVDKNDSLRQPPLKCSESTIQESPKKYKIFVEKQGIDPTLPSQLHVAPAQSISG